jgi:hypothetical protein
MKHLLTILLLSMPLTLAGCAKENTYPISGAPCGEEDPVATLDAADCAGATPAVSGF